MHAKISYNLIAHISKIQKNVQLWCTHHEPNQVAKAFQKSLDNLNISYIDLYLMHAPLSYQRLSKTTNLPTDDIDDTIIWPHYDNGTSRSLDIDYIDTWKAMEELVKTGKVRSLGVSNFNSQQLDRLVSAAQIKPVVNQVECHPNLNQKKLIAFAKERNVTIVGYSPLGRPADTGDRNLAIKNVHVQKIADKYKRNPGQILLRYSHQNGVIVIPKSTNKQRLRGNIDIFDFILTDEEMQTMDNINDNTRIIGFEGNENNKYFPFNIEF